MKENTLRKVLIIILFAGLLWILPNIVNAAYISVTPSTKNAKPGQAVSVTISSDCTGKVSLSASNGTVSTGSIWVEGSTSVTVTVGSSGTTTVSAKATDMSDSAGNATSPSGSATITIVANSSSSTSNNGTSTGTNSNNNNSSTTKSSVATLSNLGIRPNDFSGFSANKTSYSTEVPNNVETIEIYANKGQSGQTISGTGKKTLKEGTNTFNIVVTAEDGKAKKTYTLTVNRKAKDESSTENETSNETKNEVVEEETNEIEDTAQENFGLAKLSISGLELQPQFQIDVYEYRIELKENLEKLDIKAIATQENASIEITGNENLQDGENIITILVKGDTEDKNVAYQIIVNKVEQSQEKKIDKNKIVIIAGATGIILIIAIIVIVKKIRNSKDTAFVPYENLFDSTKDNKYIDTFETSNDPVNPAQNDEKTKEKSLEFFEDEEVKPKRKKRSKGKRFK